MNIKRIGRSLICLLLVCVLLVNASPIKAKAVGPAFAAIAAQAVLSSILIGLGVNMLGGVETVEAQVLSNLTDHLVETTDYIMDGLVSVAVQYPDAATEYDNVMAYVDQGLVEAVREWLFSSETIVEEEVEAPAGYAYYNGVLLPIISTSANPRRCIVKTSAGVYKVFYQYYGSIVVYDGYFTTSGSDLADRLENGKWVSNSWDSVSKREGTFSAGAAVIWADYDVLTSDNSVYLASSDPIFVTPGDVTVAEGLTAGYIAPQSQTLEEGYAEWTKNQIELILEDMYETHIAGLPIALGNTDDETAAMDQASVWAGASTWSGSGLDTDTDIGNDTETDSKVESDMGIEVDNSKLTDTVGNTNAGTFLDTLLGNIAKPFEWIWANIQTFFTTAYNNISAWISNQTMAISNFFDAAVTGILEGLKELFIPTEDYLTVKVDAMCAEFAFVDSIVRTANELKTGLAGVTTEPPVIYIDLGATRGSYDIGGEVPFLDLRWYSEYKGTVDAIISAFLWICFAWRMLLKLPGIISGMPGDFVMASAHNMGITDYLPSRTKEYEIQRISNREMIRKGPDK